MKVELYQKCSLCNGTQVTAHSMMVDGLKKPDGSTFTGLYATGLECPCAWTDHVGFDPVGLTLRQVESTREDRDRLLILLDDLSRMNDEERAGVITQAIGRRGAEIVDIRQRQKV